MNTIFSKKPNADGEIAGHFIDARRSIPFLLLCLSMLGCSPGDIQPVSSITDGVWVGHADPDLFCFQFVKIDNDSLTGLVHSVRDGKMYSEMPFAGTLRNGSTVEIEMGATQVTYTGAVDLNQGRISGNLIYADGSKNPMELHWMKPTEIGGLQARSEAAGDMVSYTYNPPIDTTHEMVTGSIEDVGLSPEGIESLVTAVINGEAGVLHSLLVTCNDTLVVEEYFHGYGADDLHGVASVTKSVSSLLVGIALDQGKIDNIDNTIPSFFPESPVSRIDGWDRETLRHLLTMSMGLDWNEEEAEILHGTGPGFFNLVFKHHVVYEPGTRWNYVNAEADLLSGVFVHSTGMSPEEFARRYLFEPLGIRHWDWSGMAVGEHRLMDGSLWLRPRDMAKIGILVLSGGMWNGRRVVSEDWIEASTMSQISTGQPMEGFGYLWWIGSLPTSAGLEPVILANGWGSQFIAIFPDRDLVLVTTGANEYNGKHFALASLVSRYLLSDFKK